MEKRSLTQLALAGMMAGGFALSACEDNMSGKTDPAINGAKTMAEFQTACEKLGGMFKTHDCQGLNECKGHSFADDKGVAVHDCKGHSTCKGGSCIES